MMKLAPQIFDLTAHYEPRADFTLSLNVRRSLEQLAKKYRRYTLMSGKHSGKPTVHTDIKGISVGSRIELSRLVLRPSAQTPLLAEAFGLFREAAEKGIASGDIRRIVLAFPKAERRPLQRASALDAFQQVFRCDCCFLAGRNHLEIGRAIVHQTLVHHLWETGAYHSRHQPRVEAVQTVLRQQAGRYENHRFFVKPIPSNRHDGGNGSNGQVPDLRFCYSGESSDILVEVAMRQKTDEHLVFVSAAEVAEEPQMFVSLSDYERASRRYGTLWVMQGDLVRALDRNRASALFLFMDDAQNLNTDRSFSWSDLHERQCRCQRINRASRHSPTFLDMSLSQLIECDFVVREKGRYRLHPQFESFQHVTFYELGTYSKRLDRR